MRFKISKEENEEDILGRYTIEEKERRGEEMRGRDNEGWEIEKRSK